MYNTDDAVQFPSDTAHTFFGRIHDSITLLRHLPAGEVLFHAGEEGDTLFFIVSGSFEIYHANEGKILDRLSAGDYFGELSLVEGKPRLGLNAERYGARDQLPANA